MSEIASELDDAATARRTGGSPSREYVVLERVVFEDDGNEYFTQVHRVEARNGANALRRAYKELHASDPHEVCLAVVPASMWNPKKVRGRQSQSVSVEIV